MKRTIQLFILIILASFSLLICACSRINYGNETAIPDEIKTEHPTTTKTSEIQSFDNRFGMGYDNIAETEIAYYFSAFNSPFLYYYDKESGERGVLCAKPECMHDAGSGNNCNGNIEDIGASFNLWDGRLHYYAPAGGHCAIYSLALDGSDRRKDIEIEDAVVMPGITPQRLDYHRGMLYGYDKIKIVNNGVPLWCVCVFGIDAETGDYREIFRKESEHITSPVLYYLGSSVYIGYEEYDFNDAEEKTENYCWHLIRWDTDSEQIEQVAALHTDELGYNGRDFRIFTEDGERIFIVPMRNGTSGMDEPARVFLLENGKTSEEFRFDTTGPCFLTGGIAASIYVFEERCEIRRLDGSIIYEGILDMSFLDEIEEDQEYELDGISSVMGDSNELFISFYVEPKIAGESRICLVRYDLTSGTPVPMVIACAKRV